MFASQVDAFSPSQFASPSQNDATTPSKFRGASGTTRLTVKQIVDAQLAGAGQAGAPFAVDGVETANIRVVGTVSGKAERATDVSFTVDDGTGRIDFIRWVNDAADSAETAAIQSLVPSREFRTRSVPLLSVPVTDYNEVTLHFIQCVRMHIENTKSKIGSPAHTSSALGTPFSNSPCEASTPISLKSNPIPVVSGANISRADLNARVLSIFNEPASLQSEHGVHMDEIANRLRLPAAKIKEANDHHVNNGHIYSTIDDFHYKSAEV